MPQTKKKVRCGHCNSDNIRKKGMRKSKTGQIQKYYCKDCKNNFSATSQDFKQYPIQTILKSISTYNLGYTLKQTQEKMEKTEKTKLPISTISSWVKEYKEICTFSRLRKQAIKLYSPKNIIKKQALSHIQPYAFKYHKAKLGISISENPKFLPLKDYLVKINSEEFPHHIFTYNKNNSNSQRASQLKFNHLKINVKSKTNFACKLAKLAMNLAITNKERHEAIQNFFLINDSTTIAIEVPVYLTNWDAGYYRNQKGFTFPLNNYTTPITGHIDILQIRNSLIHILDYKPEAKNQNPTEQLTIYALALSRKLNLPLYHFKCLTCEAREETRSPCHWFDESNYFEFFPLHAVYEKEDKIMVMVR